jgi:hypothetical protein
MARRITQSTFDEAVTENMQDFELPKEAAIKDTIAQFVGQGVNLGRNQQSHIIQALFCH